MSNVWNDWGTDLNDICGELQFPIEIATITIAHESANGPRKLALEELKIPTAGTPGAADPNRNHELRLQNASIAQPVIDAYKVLTPRYGLTVPDPWNGGGFIPMANNNPSNLTWDQLLDIVDVVPERMSPGLMQTLVSVAIERMEWLQAWYPNVQGTFAVAALPVARRGWFTWLLSGRNSILAGVAYHKFAYAYWGSFIDIPRISSLYNAGKRDVGDAPGDQASHTRSTGLNQR